MLKRIVSLLLVLVMLMGDVCPLMVKAEETENTEATAVVEETAAPTEETAAPTEETAAPTEETAAPTEETAAPTEETAAPTEATAAPTVAATEVPEETVPIEVLADSVTASGTCGENLTWTLDNEGTLTISGEGALDFQSSSFEAPWKEYASEIITLVLGHGVTSLGTECFSGCINLTNIHFSETVTSIGVRAFQDCSSLKELIIPSTVTGLGEYAFQNCTGLERIYIPSGVTLGGWYIFDGCRGSTIYSGRSTPLYTPWNYDSQAQSYIDTVYGWGEMDYQFWFHSFNADPQMTEFAIPDGITLIPDGAFRYMSQLTDVTIPEGVKSIGSSAFYGCYKLSDVVLPETLESVSSDAFASCQQLTSIRIPANTTSVASTAFSNCTGLKKITVDSGNEKYCSVDGVVFTKDMRQLYIFPAGKSISVYVVPKGVEKINEKAFAYCGCKGIIFPDGLKTIDDYAMYDADITFISLPKTLQYIYAGIVNYSGLTDIYYAGTEEEWSQISIGYNNDEYLLKATLHYEGGISSSGSSGDALQWEMQGQMLCITGSGPMEDYASADDVPWEIFKEDITRIYIGDGVTAIGDYAFAGCGNLTTMQIPSSLTSVGTSAVEDCTGLSTILDMSNKENRPQRFLGSGNMAWNNAEHIVLGMTDYVDNGDITINRSGYGYGYYEGIPNRTYHYTTSTASGEAVSDENGIVKIPLGAFGVPGVYPVTVEITKVGDYELNPAMVLTAKVSVTSLSFTQEWQASFSAKVGVELIAGAKLLAAKASLGSIGGEVGRGNTIGISRTYTEEGETLVLTSDTAVDAGLKVESGITGEILSVKLSPIKTSAGVQGKVAGTYGLEFPNYSADDAQQNMAVAAFFLGEAIEACSMNLYLDPLYTALAAVVYDESFCTVINGYSGTTMASAGLDAGAFKINDTALFSALTISGETSVTAAVKANTAGEAEKSVNYLTTRNLTDNVGILEGKLGGEFLGKDTTVTAIHSQQESVLEATSLGASDPGISNFVFGKIYSAYYDRYTFRGDSLKKLLENTTNVDRFANGSRDLLTGSDIKEIAAFISESDALIPYTRLEKEQTLKSYPFEFGLGVGAGITGGVTLSYLDATTHSAASGFAKADDLWLTGESIDLSASVNAQKQELGDFFLNALDSIADLAADMFEEFTGSIKEGVDGAISWVSGAADSAYDWVVSIYSGKKNQTYSRTLSVYGSRNVTSTGEGITNVESKSFSDAATIGIATIVTVTDADTGEVVADFSVQPLEYTISYTEEDLQAAGLTSNSDIIRDGGMAMYFYSEEKGCFVYVGGIHDPEAMTVTASIEKSGQYVLAVDACAPTLSALNLSDFHQTPTITAVIDDLTGMNTEGFVFTLDGDVKVNADNLSEHYDDRTGRFTYAVPETEALCEGAHTISFTLADTTGNSETYEYSFNVDLTAPVIAEVTVNGATNAGASVEIRAQVGDPNLTAVYAVFSKLLPDGTWSEEVGTLMGNMGDGIWGLDYEGDGSSIRVYVRAGDIAGNVAESDISEAYPFVESLTIPQDYITLYEGQSVQLVAQAQPLEFADDIKWSVETQDGTVISVDETGIVTAQGVGTAYVLATVTDGEKSLTARCRVDVAESVQLDGIQLSTTKLTTQLYSTDYAGFEVLLQLPQNYPVAATTYSLRGQNTGVAMESARFTSDAVAELFEIVVLDDRSVLVIPTDYAVANPKQVKEKYTSTVTVTVQGAEYVSEKLTLTVKKSTPKLKASVKTFNSFYSGQSREIVITGGTPTVIYENTSKATPIPKWLALENGTLTLTENAPLKSTSAKAYIMVETEEWRIPAAVTLSVKNTYKARGLKLSASSVTVSTVAEDSNGVSLKLRCTSKKDTLAGLNVTDITAPDGYTIENFNIEDGSFTLKANSGFEAGTVTLKVNFSDTTVIQSLKLTVKTARAALKTSVKKLTLNRAVSDSAVINVTATPADYRITAPTIRLTTSKGVDKLNSGELEIRYDNGQIKVSTTENTPAKAAYKLYISAGGSKEAVVTISTISGTPSVSFKAKGSMDLSFPNQAATVTPTFKNYNGSIASCDYTVAEKKGKTVVNEDVSEAFSVEQEGKTFKIRCIDEDAVNTSNTYVFKLKLFLTDGSSVENTISLKVKRTAVKLKLSSTKLSLNKLIDDEASVTVTCTTRGYAFDAPIWQLMDKSGKVSAEGRLDISYADGKLTVAVNEATEYGAAYKIILKANEKAPSYTLTVTIPTEAKSKITASLKVSGKLDVIRDGSAVTIKPSYKNCIATAKGEEELYIYSSADGYTEPVNHLFAIEANGKGGYTVTKAEGAQLSHSLKYKVRLVTAFGNTKVESALVSMTVTMGSAKLTLQNGGTTLFAKDRNDRVMFWFEAKDAALNEVVSVKIKDTKYKDVFEVIEYGDGVFAIGFKDGVVNKSIVGKTITLNLNIYLDGNQTTKANTTVKLKVTVVK